MVWLAYLNEQYNTVNALLTLYRHTLLNEVHHFIHLNLSIALLLSLTVFVAGIETATSNEVRLLYTTINDNT